MSAPWGPWPKGCRYENGQESRLSGPAADEVRQGAGDCGALSTHGEAGFTLASSAAQALGISKQTLSDLELGTGTVTLALAFQALNALGVSVFVVPAQDNSRVRRALKAAGLGT